MRERCRLLIVEGKTSTALRSPPVNSESLQLPPLHQLPSRADQPPHGVVELAVVTSAVELSLALVAIECIGIPACRPKFRLW